MSAEKFFVDGFGSDELYKQLIDSPSFPLVRDLEHKFKLRVIRRVKVDAVGGGSSDAWLLGHTSGIAVGKAFVQPSTVNDGKDQFAFRTPYYAKERGSSRADKETVRSAKVSSLMAALSRCNVIPSLSDMETRKAKQVRNAQEVVRRSMGPSDKSVQFTANEIHALLLMALGRSPSSEWVKVDQNKCQTVLDKFEEADRLKKEKAAETQRMFFSPFWMIGVDEFGDYLIGKYKLSHSADETVICETIQSFKRYRSYEQVPELIPLMTMVKVAYENEPRKAQVLPVTDKHDVGLDAVFFYNTQPTHYDHVWMVAPCST